MHISGVKIEICEFVENEKEQIKNLTIIPQIKLMQQ